MSIPPLKNSKYQKPNNKSMTNVERSKFGLQFLDLN
jgi:hypothetical protein